MSREPSIGILPIDPYCIPVPYCEPSLSSRPPHPGFVGAIFEEVDRVEFNYLNRTTDAVVEPVAFPVPTGGGSGRLACSSRFQPGRQQS